MGACRDRLDIRWEYGKRNSELVGRWLEGCLAQPDYPSFVVSDPGALTFVKFEVSMDDGVRMPTVSFVQMFRGNQR